MDDLISRKAAIDALRTWDQGKAYLPIEFRELVEGLPSAVVRCKDCKKRGTQDCRFGITVFDAPKNDDFCSYGERVDHGKA